MGLSFRYPCLIKAICWQLDAAPAWDCELVSLALWWTLENHCEQGGSAQSVVMTMALALVNTVNISVECLCRPLEANDPGRR